MASGVGTPITDRWRHGRGRAGATPPRELRLVAVVLRARSRRGRGSSAGCVRENSRRKSAIRRPLFAEDVALRRHPADGGRVGCVDRIGARALSARQKATAGATGWEAMTDDRLRSAFAELRRAEAAQVPPF